MFGNGANETVGAGADIGSLGRHQTVDITQTRRWLREFSTGPIVTFQAAGHHRPLAMTK